AGCRYECSAWECLLILQAPEVPTKRRPFSVGSSQFRETAICNDRSLEHDPEKCARFSEKIMPRRRRRLSPSGVAAEIGLSTGDVILDVGGKGVKSPEDFYKALAGVQTQGKRIALARIKSNDATRFVAIPVK